MVNKDKKIENLSPEDRKDLSSRVNARNIVQIILDYGVSQHEMVYIIKFLALELEDVHLMQKINELIEDCERFTTGQLEQQEEGLAIPNKKIYT